MTEAPYSADRSLYGKLRRRLARVMSVRPAQLDLSRPMLTFSFDDAPASSACAGARILDRHGGQGTWFISAGLMGHSSHLGTYTRVDEVKALAAVGHEIGCHTFSHLDCGRAGGRDIVRDLDRNQQAIRNMHLPPSRTFAYPYGDVSPQAKTVLNQRYIAARALHHGLITTGTDLNQAPAVGIEGEDGEKTALHWLRKAAETPAWLVLYTHDVRDNPSAWGCTPDALERLAAAAVTLGFELVTFEAGALRATAPAPPVQAQAA